MGPLRTVESMMKNFGCFLEGGKKIGFREETLFAVNRRLRVNLLCGCGARRSRQEMA